MKLTLDASVHLAALNPGEAGSEDCQALLRRLHGEDRDESVAVVSPTLMIVEVAASVAGALGDPGRAAPVYQALRGLSGQTMIPLSELLAEETSRLAAECGLSGSCAVYGAVAQLYGTTLVTLDRDQERKLSPVIGVWRPDEALRQLSAESS